MLVCVDEVVEVCAVVLAVGGEDWVWVLGGVDGASGAWRGNGRSDGLVVWISWCVAGKLRVLSWG